VNVVSGKPLRRPEAASVRALDSELNDYGGQIGLGSELAVSFSQIREHRKSTEFRKQ
jgi:hypothetical protein